jgi:hypothetical protein
MQSIPSLKGALADAWKRTLDEYWEARINSESTLQAVFFGHIRAVLPECAVFCEPTIQLRSLGTANPDILVVSGNMVIAAIELKFAPHHFPRFEDDLRKLRRYRKYPKPFELALDPLTGQFAATRAKFGANCLFVFAVIGRHDAVATDKDVLNTAARLERQFLPLVCKVPGARSP